MERLPDDAKLKDAFYFAPLQKFSSEKGEPWFSAVPVGKNTLDRIVKDSCEEAGVAGKTNHSLRATGATRMYHKGITERAIQARTGHKSLDALRTYERVSTEQEKQMCHVLGDVANQTSPILTWSLVNQVHVNLLHQVLNQVPYQLLHQALHQWLDQVQDVGRGMKWSHIRVQLLQ